MKGFLQGSIVMKIIDDIATPKTLRTFKTSDGNEYVLKGLDAPKRYTDMAGVRQNESNILKLYKKTNIDGLDTFTLMRKKEEKYILNYPNPGEKELSLIRKEAFEPKTGKMIEQVEIAENVGGGKTIRCNGDVFQMSGNLATNRPVNKPEIRIDLGKGNLTPAAKRILKILTK